MKPHLLVSLLLAFTASIVVSADTIHFKDGSKREGTVKEDKDDVVVFEMRHGSVTATMRFERKDIVKIDKVEVVETAEERKHKLLVKTANYITKNSGTKSDSVDAWMRVAEFCEKTPGFEGGVRDAYRQIIAIDPENDRIMAWLRSNDAEIASVTSRIYDESLSPEQRYTTLDIPQERIDYLKNMEIVTYVPSGAEETYNESYTTMYYPQPQQTTAPATTSATTYENSAPYRGYNNGYYNNYPYGKPVVWLRSDGKRLQPVYVGSGGGYLPLNYNYYYNNYYYNNGWRRIYNGGSNYTNGRQYWDQRPNYTWNRTVYNRTGPCGNNYVQPRPTAQTVGSFQDARTSTYQVPNSYFGVSTGNFDTRTQRWVGPRPR